MYKSKIETEATQHNIVQDLKFLKQRKFFQVFIVKSKVFLRQVLQSKISDVHQYYFWV